MFLMHYTKKPQLNKINYWLLNELFIANRYRTGLSFSQDFYARVSKSGKIVIYRYFNID